MEQDGIKYSTFKLWLLKTWLIFKGKRRMKRFVVGETYYGGRNKRYGIYRGDGKFYEQFTVSGPGYCYFDAKTIQYQPWELGMFKWSKATVKVENVRWWKRLFIK